MQACGPWQASGWKAACPAQAMSTAGRNASIRSSHLDGARVDHLMQCARRTKRSIWRLCQVSPDHEQVFGKPMASREIWERFRDDARQQLQNEILSEAGDPVIAALQVAAEDDAICTKSTVALPVDAFSKRLDSMVISLKHQIDRDDVDLSEPSHALEYLKNMLFSTLGFRVAPGSMDAYRPYRIYMHKVLTQRIGTQPALGALLAGFVLRAQRAGIVGDFKVEVRAPEGGGVPEARVALDDSDPKWSIKLSQYIERVASQVHELYACRATGMQCVVACIQQLKRSNWCWPWNPSDSESFEKPARSFLGEFGRTGVNSPVVGVMHTSGRPYGDLELALAACEKLAAVQPAVQMNIDAARNIRDQGLLLCHKQRYAEARGLLRQYRENNLPLHREAEVHDSGEGMSRAAEAELIDQVIHHLDTEMLEHAFSVS